MGNLLTRDIESMVFVEGEEDIRMKGKLKSIIRGELNG